MDDCVDSSQREETKKASLSTEEVNAVEADVMDTEIIGDDDDDKQSRASSEDMDLLLIAQDSDSSDESSSSDESEAKSPRTTDVDDEIKKTMVTTSKPSSSESAKTEDDADTEVDDEKDVAYKVKVTRFGGGDFEGFEITHEPVIASMTSDGREESEEQETDEPGTDSGETETGISSNPQEIKKPSNAPEIEKSSNTQGPEKLSKPQETLKSSSPREKSFNPQETEKSLLIQRDTVEQTLKQETETQSSKEKTEMQSGKQNEKGKDSSSDEKPVVIEASKLDDAKKEMTVVQPEEANSGPEARPSSPAPRLPPASPASGDFKPSTPGTLSSQSSTTGSLDETSSRGLDESAGSAKIRAMRNSTRVRRESREQREREEKLTMSEKSREKSRTKSQDDIAQRRGRPKSVEDEPVSPKAREKMTRAGFEFRPGFRLEAMDYLNKWYPAKIVQVNEEKHKILIHFEGWNSRYDEWVIYNSPKIRPHARTSNRKEGVKESPAGNYTVGDEVLARWSDCRYYPGKIVSINDSGTYRIIFYDGIEKNVQGMNVREMPEPLKQQDFFSNLQPQIERAMKNADQRKQRLKRLNSAENPSSTPSSATSSPPEERKRRLSSPTPSPAQVKRSRSQDEVTGSSESEGKLIKVSSSSEEEVKRSKVMRAVSSRAGVARKGHFLMGGGLKKKEDRSSARRSLGRRAPPKVTATGLKHTPPRVTATGLRHASPKVPSTGLKQTPPKVMPVGLKQASPKPPAVTPKPVRETRATPPVAKMAPSPAPSMQVKEEADTVPSSATEGSTDQTASKKSATAPAAQSGKAKPGFVFIPVIENVTMDERLEVANNLEKLRAKASKEPLFSSSSIHHLKDQTKFIAPKELIVDLDHNKFKCDVEGCNKAFRKESLLASHIKYYHTELGEGVSLEKPTPKEREKPREKEKPKDKERGSVGRPRKRNYSATLPTAATKLRRESGNSSSAASSPSSSPPAKLMAKRSSAPSTLFSSSATSSTLRKAEPFQRRSSKSPPPMRSPKSPPPIKSPKSPPLMRSPKSPPVQSSKSPPPKSPMSPPPPPPKSPMSPPTTVPKLPKVSPSGVVAKETKLPKDVKPPKESKPKSTNVSDVKIKKEKMDQAEAVGKLDEKTGILMTASGRTKETKLEKRRSFDDKVHPNDEKIVKTHKVHKQTPGVAVSETKKTEKLSPNSLSKPSSRSSTPGVTSVRKEDGAKSEGAGGVLKNRDGVTKKERLTMSQLEKLKQKKDRHKEKEKEKEKYRKHKDKRKKRKKDKKEDKKKKKKKKKRLKDGAKISVIRGQEKYKDTNDYFGEKKKREFQFEMPVPMSEYKSETFGRHTTPILKSQLLRSVDRTDGIERGNGEVIRCICYKKTEEGFMIQCEKCLCWQHSSCVGLTKHTVPDHYVCLICFNPRDQRVAAKYRFGQKWMQDGDLAAFTSAPKTHAKEAAHNLAATNRLIGEMHVINEVLRGLKEKLRILQTPNHPDLKLWARSWLKPKEPKKKPEAPPVPNLDLSLSLGPSIALGDSMETEASLTPLETEQIARIMAMSGDPDLASLAFSLPYDVGIDSSAASSIIDGSLVKEDQSLGEMEVEGMGNVGDDSLPKATGDAIPMGTGDSVPVGTGVYNPLFPGGADGAHFKEMAANLPGADGTSVGTIPGANPGILDTAGRPALGMSSGVHQATDVPVQKDATIVGEMIPTVSTGSDISVTKMPSAIPGSIPATLMEGGSDAGASQNTADTDIGSGIEQSSAKEHKIDCILVSESESTEQSGGNDVTGQSSANVPKRQSREDDVAPPTVKFVSSTGTQLSSLKKKTIPVRTDSERDMHPTKNINDDTSALQKTALIDISDIPSTSAGPSQQQLEAAGMMRIQPLTFGRARDTDTTSEDDEEDEEMEVDEITTDVLESTTEDPTESELEDSEKKRNEVKPEEQQSNKCKKSQQIVSKSHGSEQSDAVESKALQKKASPEAETLSEESPAKADFGQSQPKTDPIDSSKTDQIGDDIEITPKETPAMERTSPAAVGDLTAPATGEDFNSLDTCSLPEEVPMDITETAPVGSSQPTASSNEASSELNKPQSIPTEEQSTKSASESQVTETLKDSSLSSSTSGSTVDADGDRKSSTVEETTVVRQSSETLEKDTSSPGLNLKTNQGILEETLRDKMDTSRSELVLQVGPCGDASSPTITPDSNLPNLVKSNPDVPSTSKAEGVNIESNVTDRTIDSVVVGSKDESGTGKGNEDESEVKSSPKDNVRTDSQTWDPNVPGTSGINPGNQQGIVAGNKDIAIKSSKIGQTAQTEVGMGPSLNLPGPVGMRNRTIESIADQTSITASGIQSVPDESGTRGTQNYPGPLGMVSEAPTNVNTVLPDIPCSSGTSLDLGPIETGMDVTESFPGPLGMVTTGVSSSDSEVSSDVPGPSGMGATPNIPGPLGMGSGSSQDIPGPSGIGSNQPGLGGAPNFPGPLGMVTRDPHDIPGPSGLSSGSGIKDLPGPSGLLRIRSQHLPSTAVPGPSSWIPPQQAPPPQKEKDDEKEIVEYSKGLKVIKVARKVCIRNLKEHIEYLETELEKRMDIIEEETAALEKQFAELPGLSPDIRGLATMNDTFLKNKLQNLHGDMERISNLVSL